MALHAAAFLFLLQAPWIVDDNGGPGVDFTDLPPAVAAAADGDAILVRAGVYSNFSLSGKGLRILGQGSASTIVSMPVPGTGTTISAVPAASAAYLDRIQFLGPLSISGLTTRTTLADLVAGSLSSNGALVHADRSTFFPLSTNSGAPGVAITNGARVHVASSGIQGGQGNPGHAGVSLSGLPFSPSAGSHSARSMEALGSARPSLVRSRSQGPGSPKAPLRRPGSPGRARGRS